MMAVLMFHQRQTMLNWWHFVLIFTESWNPIQDRSAPTAFYIIAVTLCCGADCITVTHHLLL